MKQFIRNVIFFTVGAMLGIIIGRFLIPKPVEIIPLERLEVQTEGMKEISRAMNLCMDEYDDASGN